MKVLTALLASSSLAAAISIPSWRDAVDAVQGQQPFTPEPLSLIELSGSDTRWVTDDEKWALRREGKRFFDITDKASEYKIGSKAHHKAPKTVTYPKKTAQNESVSELLKELDKENMRSHLETFTSFHTRYYKSDYGRKSSEWLLDQVNQTLNGVGIARHFVHEWGTFLPSEEKEVLELSLTASRPEQHYRNPTRQV